jgi:hypothetical protein
MNDDEITNGQRAAVAMDAIAAYARFEHPMELRFFLEEEGEVDLEAVKGRLGDLLCGLLHYAELREISFDDVLITAKHEYDQQRTWYLPGDAVQLASGARQAGPADARVGEILKARPGNPPAYLVDFIAVRVWYPEPGLAPAEHFPAVTTGYGIIGTAYAAQHCLNQTARRIQDARNQGGCPEAVDINDLRTFLTTLSGWSGMPPPALLKFLGLEHLAESGTLPLAAVPGAHPVSLAATDVATPLQAGVPDVSYGDRRRAPAPPIRPATKAPWGGGR